MKRVLLLVVVSTSCPSCDNSRPAEPESSVVVTETGRVVARVIGLRNDHGSVIARLYRGEEGFPSDAALAFREETFEIQDGAATVAFAAVPHGEYAIWICHDEDSDGDLKTNFLGMPGEGVGVSGPPPSFIPGYLDARFTLDSALSEHEILVKYL